MSDDASDRSASGGSVHTWPTWPGNVNVIFLEPSFPDNQKQFVRALHDVGATVIGIGERPKDWLGDDVKSWLTHYEQVPSIVDEDR